MLERAEALGEEMRGLGDRSTEMLQTVAASIQALAEQMHKSHAEGMGRIADAVKAVAAPRRIVRDKDGRAAGVELA